jgi:hypothetical protein
MFIVFVVAFLVLLESVRRGSKGVLILEYQYKLFALRDELRGHVIQNPSLANSWVFMYLDSTITKFVGVLPEMTIWKTIALLLTYSNDYRFKVHRGQLEREYQKPRNAGFKQIEIKLMALTGQFVTKRHIGLRLSFEVLRRLAFSVQTTREVITWAKLQRKASLVVVVEAPETSTLGDYCPV